MCKKTRIFWNFQACSTLSVELQSLVFCSVFHLDQSVSWPELRQACVKSPAKGQLSLRFAHRGKHQHLDSWFGGPGPIFSGSEEPGVRGQGPVGFWPLICLLWEPSQHGVPVCQVGLLALDIRLAALQQPGDHHLRSHMTRWSHDQISIMFHDKHYNKWQMSFN